MNREIKYIYIQKIFFYFLLNYNQKNINFKF